MTKKYLLLTALITWAGNAQELKLVSSHPAQLGIKNTTAPYVSAQTTINGAAYEDFSGIDAVLMLDKDAPALPMVSESLIIPNTGNVTIDIAYDSYAEFDNIHVAPSKGSLKRNVNPASIPLHFGAAYNTDAFFPGALAKAGTPYVFRDTRGVTVTFYPYQYNPVTHQLRVYKNITVTVSTDAAQQGTNEKLSSGSTKTAVFASVYRNHYLNAPEYQPIADEGEILVITPSDYMTALQPYIDWKIEKGINVNMAYVTEAGETSAEIQNYIKNAYLANSNLAYVQLVGDFEDLPSHTYGSPGSEELWSDSYYGQMDGADMYPELLVGRFSGSPEEVQTQVSRTIEYETNPLAGDWMTRALGIGSNEGDGYGDDGEPDWLHLRHIGQKLIEYGYAEVHEFYDGSHGEGDGNGSPDAQDITAAVNAGVGLFNYTGHGWNEGMSTGNYTNAQANLLTNNGKYPFVVSVACNNGTYVGGTSLCEAFLNKTNNNTPAGAIASCGSSILMAWAEPMQTQDEMAELITRSNLENVKTSLGGLFYNGQASMLEAYNQSNTSEEVMQTWVFFGDASTIFRDKVTTDITATHAPTISLAGGMLDIASDTEGALVSIVQDNEILTTGLIADGHFDATIPALFSDSALKVTLTKANKKPYRGIVNTTALAVAAFESQFAIYPNPASHQLHILNKGQVNGAAQMRIVDVNGRLLWTANETLGVHYSIPVSQLSQGIYVLTIEVDGQQKAHKFIIE
ncbi:C25 family cysteine peptidase [Flavobacterium caeni]|uniref:Peptidase family C25, C terminal ig-like domain n=1 Tax=Flavobacterium caeni TaxID=490189 RepID=A0A1G5FEJ5_9FLAO|nr:C25 family cysteine peptidase [Flavobacterium caeni]SCY37564.1 Peptidase family C25, C terminal ig-like domain [Flavobacterium caeni]